MPSYVYILTYFNLSNTKIFKVCSSLDVAKAELDKILKVEASDRGGEYPSEYYSAAEWIQNAENGWSDLTTAAFVERHEVL